MRYVRNLSRRMLVIITASLAALVMAAGVAVAVTAGGPPVNMSPGPEYAPGDVVYLCVNQLTESVRVEVHTDSPGNCAAHEVQLPVVVASPYPTPL
jgi:hypothetical protein